MNRMRVLCPCDENGKPLLKVDDLIGIGNRTYRVVGVVHPAEIHEDDRLVLDPTRPPTLLLEEARALVTQWRDT